MTSKFTGIVDSKDGHLEELPNSRKDYYSVMLWVILVPNQEQIRLMIPNRFPTKGWISRMPAPSSVDL